MSYMYHQIVLDFSDRIVQFGFRLGRNYRSDDEIRAFIRLLQATLATTHNSRSRP